MLTAEMRFVTITKVMIGQHDLHYLASTGWLTRVAIILLKLYRHWPVLRLYDCLDCMAVTYMLERTSGYGPRVCMAFLHGMQIIGTLCICVALNVLTSSQNMYREIGRQPG
jgi:hypothetical protein